MAQGYIKRGHPILFGLLLIFSIIELSLSAYLTSRYNSHHNYRSISQRDRVRYVLFCSVWTILFSLFFLVTFLQAATGSILSSVGAHIAFFILTFVMWIAASAAVTETIGGSLNCSTQTVFVYCGQLNALQAFAWMITILLAFGLIVSIIRGISASRRGDGYGGSLVTA